MSSRTIHSPLQGETATYLETSSETGGEHTLMEFVVSPGGGPPEHYHDAVDEEIVVVQGPIWISLGGRGRLYQTGERVFIARGVPHAFRNTTEGEVKFQVRFTPGHPGFENFLRVMFGLAEDGQLKKGSVPKDFKTLAMLIRWGDTNMPGPMGVMNPVFRWVAKRAEAAGLGDRLRQRYGCQ